MDPTRFKIIRPGQMSTVQDGGRKGYRNLGIPYSGFMDRHSAHQANQLVGNRADQSLIEMIQVGLTVVFESTGTIAVTGADMGAQLNGRDLPRHTAVAVHQGDLLELGKARNQMIAYLAVRGDWDIPEVLGSTSTFVRAKVGGISGRPLQKEDRLCVRANTSGKAQKLPEHQINTNPPGRKIRLLKSAESTDALCDWLVRSTFEVTHEWDRMGIRLATPAPAEPPGKLLTSPVTVGTIQLPPDGQPIIVMVDGQTTGGYPRIATVIKADLPYLVQQPPGTLLSFTFISRQQSLYIEKWNSLAWSIQ